MENNFNRPTSSREEDEFRESCLMEINFQKLEREISLILEERSHDIYESFQSPSDTFQFNNEELERKFNYFRQLSSNIGDSKSNFLNLYEKALETIENMTQRIISQIKFREVELKEQLRNIATERLRKWNRQLSNCAAVLSQLQEDRSVSSNHIICTDESDLVDSGDLRFDAPGYPDILKSIQTLGFISYQNESICGQEELNSLRGAVPKFIVGDSGSGAGQFCRPWGVCSDKFGRIFICDRSNHRIQVFSEFGKFLYEFGEEGSGPGKFNRPTGIEVDSRQRIVVSDKDNHRVQIFTINGNYLFHFGSEGSGAGQFLYPWDVASNKNCDIAVSDSKNRRIQLFNEKGVVLKIFQPCMQNPRLGNRILDSPRGITFRHDGVLFITDFNNHHVLVVNTTLDKFFICGSEGVVPGKFFRPQGITCDITGKFAVSDSKNYRIQIFNKDGTFLKSFGNKGNGPGQFDCPQGICFHYDRNIVVADLSNSRIQIF